MPSSVANPSRDPLPAATQVVLREAKRLHRAATSDSLCVALPVLRRILAARACQETTLPDLFRRRHTVQRKHVLRTLAVEAGHRSWEGYRPALALLDAQELEPFAFLERGCAKLNLWFSSEPEALKFTAQHGGRAVRVGRQAIVLPAAEAQGRDGRGC